MINFNIPGLYEHYNIVIPFCFLIQNHPEYFIDDLKIHSIYGNFQFSCWDGGRVFGHYTHASQEDIIKLRDIYNNDLGAAVRLIYTISSAVVTQDDCYSRFDNVVATLCHNDMNEIVVNAPLLENYLRYKYPNYKFISSTTKCLNEPEKAIEELSKDKYFMVCLDYNLNKNQKFLDMIPQELYPKVEFLTNAICPPGCPVRKRHYDLNSLFSQTYGQNYHSLPACGIRKDNFYPNHFKNNLTQQDIQEYYKKGFVNFKLEGRTFLDLDFILNLVDALVKPEYVFSMISMLYYASNDFNLDTYNIEKMKGLDI